MTNRSTAILIVLVATLAITRAPAAYACKRAVLADRFTMFDDATTVAVVKVEPRADPKPYEIGDVPLRVVTILKGAAATKLTTKLSGSSCDAILRPSHRTLVFLDGSGHVIEDYEGAVELADTIWPDLLRRWGAASKASDRATFLADLIATAGPTADQAAIGLAEHPDVLAALTPTQVKSLIASLPKMSEISMLPLVLARLHAPGLVPQIKRRDRGPDDPATFVFGDLARELAPIDGFEQLKDTNALADAIAHAKDWHQAAAAFDRCERVRGTRLDIAFQYYYNSYGFPVGSDHWKDAAAACRSGKKVT